MPLPAEGKKLGTLALVNPRAENRLYVLTPWATNEGHTLQMFDMSVFGPGGVPTPSWKSPKLAGPVLDFALGTDPRGTGKKGIFVLEATGPEGKGRQVEFFAQD